MKFLSTLMFFLLPVVLFAHGVPVKEGTVKMGKTKLWCFSAEFPNGKDITIETIEKNFTDAGVKRTTHKKGFSIYRGASWQAINSGKGDYYYKVANKKGKTTVYLCASKGYDNYVTSANDAETAGKISMFFHDLGHQLATAQSIKEKEAELINIEQKNAEINKQLKASKKEEEAKAKEIEALKKK